MGRHEMRHGTRQLLIAALAAGIALAAPRAALADDARDGSRHVQRIAVQVMAILRDKRLDRHRARARLEAMLIGHIDVRRLGPMLLGPRWRQLSAAQRADYLRVLPRYLVRGYAKRLVRNRGVLFLVKRAEAGRTGAVTVTTHIIDPEDPAPLIVKWRLRRTAHGFKVRDLVVQNFSMALNLRREFATILRRHDGRVAGLIAKLKG